MPSKKAHVLESAFLKKNLLLEMTISKMHILNNTYLKKAFPKKCIPENNSHFSKCLFSRFMLIDWLATVS